MNTDEVYTNTSETFPSTLFRHYEGRERAREPLLIVVLNFEAFRQGAKDKSDISRSFDIEVDLVRFALCSLNVAL